jgi:tellurite resistance protein TehA-like permease
VWFGLAIAVWLVLAVLIVRRFVLDRAGWLADARTPPALTAVAATSVLGNRFSMAGWQPVAWVLLGIAGAAWLVLMPIVLSRWHHPTVGGSFLVVVATQSLVVIGGAVALADGVDGLIPVLLVLLLVGLVGYLWVLGSFDWTQVIRGRGDHWVLAGALAISALASSRLVSLTGPHGMLTGWHAALKVVDLVLVGLALAGYAVLAVAEAGWPRTEYHVTRWATVFPLGMTAAACMSSSGPTGVSWLHTLGQALLWPAVAVWVVVATGAVRNEPASLLSPAPDDARLAHSEIGSTGETTNP